MQTRLLQAAIALAVLAVIFLAAPQDLNAQKRKDKQNPSPAAQANQAATASQAATSTDEDKDKKEDPTFKGMKYRLIGPFRGGRSLTATGIPGDPTTYYFGGTGGGVWKSTDGAFTWSSVFDKEGTSSIGSLAVSVSDPNTIYVGTGEACLRGNISHGDGVYKSVDGGKTWDRVLYKDDNTGAVDLAFDPKNPNIIFASLWETRRSPWALSSGGPGSGLYRSNDGGTTWKKLTDKNLPKGPWGRVGVSVGANSDRVYALIQASEGGLYRSDDGGDTWQLVNPSHSLIQRPWYYMHIIADPQDSETVYIMNGCVPLDRRRTHVQ